MSSRRYNRDYTKEVYSFSSDEEGPYNRSHHLANSNGRKNSSHKKSPRKANNSTVSLLDFDRDYPQYDNDKYSGSKVGGGGLGEVCQRCVQWVQSASTWKVTLVGLVLGVAFAMLYQVMRSGVPRNGSGDNLLPCPSDKMRDSVHARAGLSDCGVKSAVSRNITLGELTQQFGQDFDTLLRNAMYLILYNPHWGIRWLDKDGLNKTRWNFPEPSDILDSTQPLLTWRCHLSFALSYLRGAVLVLGACLLVVAMVWWYMIFREQKKKEVYLMVERVLDVLKKHYITSLKEKDLLPYLAIIHVRDTLIPPSERKQKEDIWRKVCEWISKNDSRVRVENRRIAGEDFLVWRWIQNDPPKTEDPVLVAVDTADFRKVPGKSWSPWTAIDHYGPGGGEKVAPPIGTPSLFIRLKNMFDTIRMDDEQAKQIENAVLERCSPHGSVVHIYVDRKSTFGCVYFKMDSLSSAAKAYRALHGGWYNGKLVTAKYIEESRYVKWFPHSASAKQPLVPS